MAGFDSTLSGQRVVDAVEKVEGLNARFVDTGITLDDPTAIKLGVYIQDTTGKLWTSDAWDSSATPNGVAVLAEECSFVMAITVKGDLKIGDEFKGDIELPIKSQSAALVDFDGQGNTNSLLSIYGADDSELAAVYCSNFTFPNGKKGYLGSAGEWFCVINNKAAVIKCYEVLGMEYPDGCLTSTRASDWYFDGIGYVANRFWAASLSNLALNEVAETANAFKVYPFTTL